MSRIDNITSIDIATVPDIGSGVERLSDQEASVRIRRYLNTIKQSERTPINGDIIDFFPLVQSAIWSRQVSEKIPEEKRLLVLEEDPPESIDTEAITFYLTARVPGRLDRGSAGVGSIKEVRPHLRRTEDHPEHPGEQLVTMGKFYGTWITYNIYARTSKQALRRLLWFERVMDSFEWLFRHGGFTVIEEGVGDKEKLEIDDLKLVKYPISYFVRSDDTYQYGTQELKRLVVTVDVSLDNS